MSTIRVLKFGWNFVYIVAISTALAACAAAPSTKQVEIVPTEPYEVFFSFKLKSDDVTPLIGGQTFSLPKGKRFVIEHVTAYVFAPSGQKPIQFSFGVRPVSGQPEYSHSVVPIFLGSDPGSPGQPDRYSVSQSVRWYTVDTVGVLLQRTDSTHIMRATGTITGYLTD